MSFGFLLGPMVAISVRPRWLSAWCLPLAWGLQTLGVAGISSAAHEAVHNHLFYRPSMERLFGRMTHGIFLLNHDVHRRYHLVHHAHTGTDRDSEGAFDFDDFSSIGGYLTRLVRWCVPPSPLHLLNWRVGIDVLRGRATPLDPLPRRAVIGGFVVPVGAAAGLLVWLAINPVSALLACIFPVLCAAPLYGYLTAVPEHFGLSERPYRDRTRNIETWRPVQYLVWNFNLHAVHHRNPHLHFSLLPASSDRTEAPRADGYVRFHLDVLRRLVAGRLGRPVVTLRPERLGDRS